MVAEYSLTEAGSFSGLEIVAADKEPDRFSSIFRLPFIDMHLIRSYSAWNTDGYQVMLKTIVEYFFDEELGSLTKLQSEAFFADEKNFDLRGDSLFNSPTV
tara:strand:- start:400 stop:702 length:303 start_codon:yes stop_codon:yes gene_type:complete